MDERFPFGALSTQRPAREAHTKPAQVSVVGVYPSALHVRWEVPAWAVDALGIEPVVGALAVDVEPTVFWDGVAPDPGLLVDSWRAAVGFVEGDEPGQHGSVKPVGNGSSGRVVSDRVLAPLGASPDATFFTDLIPRFFIKRGSASRPAQADRIQHVYEPFARAADLPQTQLPHRPTPAELVAMTVRNEAGRLRGELLGAGAGTVVTLGEEARHALGQIVDEATGPPAGPLDRRELAYGRPGDLRIDEYRARWYAVTHPGNRNRAWRERHERWAESVAAS